jgi:putative endonuclease
VNLFSRILLTLRGKQQPTDRDTGAEGEAAAEKHLVNAGMRIVERNWTCVLGEVDIIGRDGDTIVFVEVKSSRRLGSVPPEFRVNHDKRRKLRSLARFYLKHRGLDVPCRFDVISVWWEGNSPQLRHIENAF